MKYVVRGQYTVQMMDATLTCGQADDSTRQIHRFNTQTPLHSCTGILTCLKPAAEDIVIGFEEVEVEANGRPVEVVLPSCRTVSRLAFRRTTLLVAAVHAEEVLAIIIHEVTKW